MQIVRPCWWCPLAGLYKYLAHKFCLLLCHIQTAWPLPVWIPTLQSNKTILGSSFLNPLKTYPSSHQQSLQTTIIAKCNIRCCTENHILKFCLNFSMLPYLSPIMSVLPGWISGYFFWIISNMYLQIVMCYKFWNKPTDTSLSLNYMAFVRLYIWLWDQTM